MVHVDVFVLCHIYLSYFCAQMETIDGSRVSIHVQQADRNKQLKGLKVHLCGDKGQSPIGVAASSLGDLINKACARFKVGATFEKDDRLFVID